MKNLIWFVAGALVMRYIILHTPDYRVKEAERLDDLRNKVHDIVKKYAPEADDEQIGDDVLATLPK